MEDFISMESAANLMDQLINEAPWRSDMICMFGKNILVPRLTAFYGDQGIQYKYSGLQMEALAWIPILNVIRAEIENTANHTFNSVLINYYRSGFDYVSWHADNEKELGHEPVIAMLSLGVERMLQFRYAKDNRKKVNVSIPDRSLLLMRGTTQQHWQHQLKRQPSITQMRISLTFRMIYR